MQLKCGRFVLDLESAKVMGIVNLTDDSFSGDGLSGGVSRAIDQGFQMVEEGAAILDLGAESSRPGALPVSAKVELERLLPVIEGLQSCGVPLSIDTCKPEVMREVSCVGADLINDIAALRAPGALEVLASSSMGVCLMHMQGTPTDMQSHPQYADVLAEVGDFLRASTRAAIDAGIAKERICIDPGFGFGKTLAHNLILLKHLKRFCDLGFPVLVGVSRKSMLGALTGQPVQSRSYAGVAAHAAAVMSGAKLVRVHDVAATIDAIKVLNAIMRAD